MVPPCARCMPASSGSAAMPKSVSFTTPSLFIKILSGFTSKCNTLCLCEMRSASATPRSTAAIISSVSSLSKCSRNAERLMPSIYSKIKYAASPSSFKS